MKNTTPILDTRSLADLLDQQERTAEYMGWLKARIDEERASLIFQKYGVKVGSIVRNPENDRTYRVTRVTVDCWPCRPTLYGNPRKSHGGFSTAEHFISFDDWGLVE